MRGGCGVQEFRDCRRGLASWTGDGDRRLDLLLLLLLLCRCRLLILLQLGGRYVAQLLHMQHESILVLGDHYVIALQQTVVQLELILGSLGLLALVLLGCCRGE